MFPKSTVIVIFCPCSYAPLFCFQFFAILLFCLHLSCLTSFLLVLAFSSKSGDNKLSSEILLEKDGMHKLKKCNDDVSSFHSQLYIAILKLRGFLCNVLYFTTLWTGIFPFYYPYRIMLGCFHSFLCLKLLALIDFIFVKYLLLLPIIISYVIVPVWCKTFRL